jgi:hypothetical protein
MRSFDLNSSPSIIRMIKSRSRQWAGHVTRIEEKRNAYRLMVGKPEGKESLERPVDNKIDPGEIGWGGVDWIDQAQERDQWRSLVKTVVNLRVP